MTRHDEREHLREAIRGYAPEIPVLVPIHLAGCQNIADCFMVNRETVRLWKKAGAPIAVIGGRLTAEYNMLMHWHVRQSANGTGKARQWPTAKREGLVRHPANSVLIVTMSAAPSKSPPSPPIW